MVCQNQSEYEQEHHSGHKEEDQPQNRDRHRGSTVRTKDYGNGTNEYNTTPPNMRGLWPFFLSGVRRIGMAYWERFPYPALSSSGAIGQPKEAEEECSHYGQYPEPGVKIRSHKDGEDKKESCLALPTGYANREQSDGDQDEEARRQCVSVYE